MSKIRKVICLFISKKISNCWLNIRRKIFKIKTLNKKQIGNEGGPN